MIFLSIYIFLLYLQQFLSCGPLLWILGQSQFDKVVEVVCPVVQKKRKKKDKRKHESDVEFKKKQKTQQRKVQSDADTMFSYHLSLSFNLGG